MKGFGRSVRRARRRAGVLASRGLGSWASRPVLHRPAAFLAAAAVNLALLALLTVSFEPRAPLGRPDPVPVVLVEIVPPPEPELEAAVPDPVPDAPVEAPPASSTLLPDVDLPEVPVRRGTPNGLVGVDCYAVFADPDRAAECAGREVRSDWRAAIAGYEADFSDALVPGPFDRGITLPEERIRGFEAAFAAKRAARRARARSPIASSGANAGSGAGGGAYVAPESFVTSHTDRRLAEDEAARREEAELQRRVRGAGE